MFGFVLILVIISFRFSKLIDVCSTSTLMRPPFKGRVADFKVKPTRGYKCPDLSTG